MNDVNDIAINYLFHKYCEHIRSVNLQVRNQSPRVVDLQPVSPSEFAAIWRQLSTSSQNYWKTRFDSYEDGAAERERLRLEAALTWLELGQSSVSTKRAA